MESMKLGLAALLIAALIAVANAYYNSFEAFVSKDELRHFKRENERDPAIMKLLEAAIKQEKDYRDYEKPTRIFYVVSKKNDETGSTRYLFDYKNEEFGSYCTASFVSMPTGAVSETKNLCEYGD